jgi:hypothetical protein
MPIVETQNTVRRVATSAAKGVRETTSLLGFVGRGMRLRVSRDASASSDIVELASRRCLVGSAPSCDVRVNEPGIAPIECLILQGAKNNVVRWFDTTRGFAGGEFFEDEILRAGDPLQVGPVELELLIDEIMQADEPATSEERAGTSEDRLAEYISRLERLELQLQDLQQASGGTAPTDAADANHEVVATISALATQLAGLQARSATDRDLWSGEKAELEAMLQSRLGEFDLLQDEVQRLREELVTVRSEYSNAIANEAASDRLVAVSQTLVERTHDFEQQQTNWERDRSEFQRQLQANMERFEQFEAQLAEQNDRQSQSDAARQAAEARADRLQESVEQLSERLAVQHQEYETVRAQWDADRTSLESELAETKEQLTQFATTESANLELREAWNRERTDLQSQIDASNSRLEEAQGELETQRRQFHEEQLSRPEAQSKVRVSHQLNGLGEQRVDHEVSGASSNPMDRLLAASSLDNDADDEYDARLRSFVSPVPQGEDDTESEYPTDQYGTSAHAEPDDGDQPFNSLRSAAYLNDETDEESTDEDSFATSMGVQNYSQEVDTEGDEVAELVFAAASPAPPVSTADVLARLGQSGAWNDDEPDADDLSDSRSTHTRSASSQYGQPQYTPVAETPFKSSIGKSANASDDEEESIEAYMARLMNRVRATDVRDEPARKPEPTVVRSPSTEYTEVKETKTAREPEPEKFNPEEYKPRSQAPELADRMTAMRSLANDSARSAIASHAKRNWSNVMKLKLLVSVFAFVSVLASIIFFWGNPLLMGLGSLIGLGVLTYWARTAITYRKLLLDSLMLEPEGGDDSSDDEDAV